MTTPKSNRPEDGEARDEGTRVRSRGAEQSSNRTAATKNTVPPPRPGRARSESGEHTGVAEKSSRDSAESLVARRRADGDRGELDRKARLAARLLEGLPPNDRRRRLLHAAILRRDEMLLDGFIEELGGG